MKINVSRRLFVSSLVPEVPKERTDGNVYQPLDDADDRCAHHHPLGHLFEKGSLDDPAEALADDEGYERGHQPHP